MSGSATRDFVRKVSCDLVRSGGSHSGYGNAGTEMTAQAFTILKRVFETIRWGQRSEGYMTENEISLQVHIAYDDEAKVWYVAKSEVPGLSLEAASPYDLMQRVVEAAPELLELNEGLLVDCVSARIKSPHDDLPQLRNTNHRPRMSVLPIFDTPLELAHA